MKCLLCGENTKEVIADKLRYGEARKVYHCNNCGLGMLQDSRTEKELKSFYNRNYRKKFTPKLNQASNPKELFEVYSNFQSTRIKLIRKFLKKDMKLLEIGCSAGMFLFQVKKYVREVAGIDYDSKSANFASQKCSCRVFSDCIDNLKFKKEEFDIICMFQVLEHTKNPVKFIEEVSKYLKPKGIIYIEVPNLNDALISAYNLPNHYNFYFHSAHLWYFTAKSLLGLMRKNNFKGKVYFTQDYNILNHMHWISADGPQSNCLPGLSQPEFRLRDKFPSDKKKKFNAFIQKMDSEYKKILTELGITSNLSFIGQKSNSRSKN
ncbi:MAG: class I SAM-dependent methyltransferase [Candidatus Omnitrophica bacterium]|nr:class I SAM-dependent methyltransferase [Candidatus Omnitrophota bacterium]MDD5429920.1 class I SAM-dependent methyltransferase [Candidatus Omnitrophota bacterium]